MNHTNKLNRAEPQTGIWVNLIGCIFESTNLSIGTLFFIALPRTNWFSVETTPTKGWVTLHHYQ